MNYRLISPAIFISLTSLVVSSHCGRLSQSADEVPFRPPNWVFAVVWPLLYMTMGIGWTKSTHGLLYWAVITGCCLWLYVYSCLKDRILSSMILMISAVIAWFIFNRGSKWDLPLAIWLSFASYLNIYDISVEKKLPPIMPLKCSASKSTPWDD